MKPVGGAEFNLKKKTAHCGLVCVYLHRLRIETWLKIQTFIATLLSRGFLVPCHKVVLGALSQSMAVAANRADPELGPIQQIQAYFETVS